MAWLKNRYVACLAASLLISCSGSEPQSQSPSPNLNSPTPQSSNRPQSNASPQPSPTAKSTAKPTATKPAASPQPNPVTTKPAAPPPVELSKSEKQLVSKVQKEVEKKGAIAKQDVGKTYLANALRSQQATQLVNGQFTSSLEALQIDLPDTTSEYQLKVLEANAEKAVVVAIAKQSGIFSYTGAVYAQEASIPISTICKSNEPTQTPPSAPKLKGTTIVCAQGSTAVE
ncbi:type IV pilin-like G/H family protein [Acaryochloris sp. IP29b_bin.148]|uniref:type IV pilin-like G/H family protein n=1 Tax=Acaryochloris sp. IP29b_bin.148 TaxID=2969218 RepID=UPI00262DB684|nr:type IV pilin-like G/H family protein [Acaryochloris sp. IP29b_bin.148]